MIEKYVWIYDGDVWGTGSTPEEARASAFAFARGVVEGDGGEVLGEDEEPVIVDGFGARIVIEADNDEETAEAVRVLVPDPTE